ncbi:hypothetical protein [Ornithinimicrobium sp. Y1694]|uniref:hypothetical protein n=1 Tax=Ornithinimicrobium sp. Y1694 TaxID=3418590 RepID=UPI003CE82D08
MTPDTASSTATAPADDAAVTGEEAWQSLADLPGVLSVDVSDAAGWETRVAIQVDPDLTGPELLELEPQVRSVVAHHTEHPSPRAVLLSDRLELRVEDDESADTRAALVALALDEPRVRHTRIAALADRVSLGVTTDKSEVIPLAIDLLPTVTEAGAGELLVDHPEGAEATVGDDVSMSQVWSARMKLPYPVPAPILARTWDEVQALSPTGGSLGPDDNVSERTAGWRIALPDAEDIPAAWAAAIEGGYLYRATDFGHDRELTAFVPEQAKVTVKGSVAKVHLTPDLDQDQVKAIANGVREAGWHGYLAFWVRDEMAWAARNVLEFTVRDPKDAAEDVRQRHESQPAAWFLEAWDAGTGR